MNMFYESVFVPIDEDYKIKGGSIARSAYENPSSGRVNDALRRKAQEDVYKARDSKDKKKLDSASERLKKYATKANSYYGERDHADNATKAYREKNKTYIRKKREEELDRHR